jgi:divalent metal cation (Fe/Co/Zn/Cd) transporter
LLLMLVAIFLVAKTKRLIVGLGVDEATLASLAAVVKTQPAVETFRPPLTMYLGPTDVVLALDVDFRDNLSAAEVEQAIEALQTAIKAVHPEFQHIFIEAKALAKRAQAQPVA